MELAKIIYNMSKDEVQVNVIPNNVELKKHSHSNRQLMIG